jgi:DNA mismatch repair protein MutL
MISRPDVSFRVSRDGRQWGNFHSTGSLFDRLRDIWSSQIAGELLKIDVAQEGPVKVGGYISKPETARGNRGEIYLFVNSRPVLEKAMFGAITAAYSNFMPPGRFPYVALFLDIKPSFVDINVHPAKTEVRFSDEGFVFSTIKKALEKTLAVPVNISFGTGTHRPHKQGAVSFDQAKQEIFSSIHSGDKSSELLERRGEFTDRSSESFDETSRELISIQVFDTFIIFKKEEELIIMDQHTAHERILYEKTLNAMNEQKAPSQKLLFEERVKLSPDESQLVQNLDDYLARSGFEIREFGPDEVIVSGLPQELADSSPGKAIKTLLSDYVEYKKEGLDSQKAFAAAVACRAAVKAGDRLSRPQMQALLSGLLKCGEPYRCPHGRPTLAVLNRDDLEKVFRRK